MCSMRRANIASLFSRITLVCEQRKFSTTGGSLRPLNVFGVLRGENKWKIDALGVKFLREETGAGAGAESCRLPADHLAMSTSLSLQERQSKAIPVISNCFIPSFRVSAPTRIFLSCWEYSRPSGLDSLTTSQRPGCSRLRPCHSNLHDLANHVFSRGLNHSKSRFI